MANKPPAPTPPEPAAPLGNGAQPARPVPALDLKGLYEWTNKVQEVKTLCMLVPQELPAPQRAQSNGGRMLFDVDMETRVNELLLAYGASIYDKPVDVGARQRKLKEIDALDTLRGVLGWTTRLLSDTVLVRREQLGRETNDLATSLIELGQSGQAESFAASSSLEALKEKQAKLLQAQRTELARVVGARVDEGTAALETQLLALQAENQRLRAQLDSVVRDSVKERPAPPAPAERRGDRR